MKNVFIGSSAFGLKALEALISSGMAPCLVVSQPERPAGRNLKPLPQPVAVFAGDAGLPLFTPEDINSEESIFRISMAAPEVLITASYGGMLGKKLRNLAPRKAINLHPSLLPQYRGATPIQSALLNGDSISGSTIFRMVAALDAGPILKQASLAIYPDENHESLQKRLAELSANLLIELLRHPDSWKETLQDHDQASLCRKINSGDEELNWQQNAQTIFNQIRAYSPLPGAYTWFRGSKLKILEAEICSETSSAKPGAIAAIIRNQGFTINCLDKPILIKQVQAAGKKVMSAAAFLNGARIIPGEITGKGLQ